MPELDGIEAARQIRESVPNAKILVVTMNESERTVRRALQAGASGYLKSDLADVLPRAVDAVVAGKRFLPLKVTEIVLEGFRKTKTTIACPKGKTRKPLLARLKSSDS
jgi:DNA-binding NarL/FixJ family response regulator